MSYIVGVFLQGRMILPPKQLEFEDDSTMSEAQAHAIVCDMLEPIITKLPAEATIVLMPVSKDDPPLERMEQSGGLHDLLAQIMGGL